MRLINIFILCIVIKCIVSTEGFTAGRSYLSCNKLISSGDVVNTNRYSMDDFDDFVIIDKRKFVKVSNYNCILEK